MYGWGATSHKVAHQWPELPPEAPPASWGAIWRKTEIPAGHYLRDSQNIGALQSSVGHPPPITHYY